MSITNHLAEMEERIDQSWDRETVKIRFLATEELIDQARRVAKILRQTGQVGFAELFEDLASRAEEQMQDIDNLRAG